MAMPRILKSYQFKFDKEQKVAVPTGQETKRPAVPEEEEEELDPALFQPISPELLAGNGEKIKVGKQARPPGTDKTTGDSETDADAEHEDADQGEADGRARPPHGTGGPPLPKIPTNPLFAGESGASAEDDDGTPAPKKGRSFAVQAALKRKQFELMALEEKLKRWEKSLAEWEQDLTKDQETAQQELRTQRAELDEEAKKIVAMARQSADSITTTAKAEAESLKKAAQLEVDGLRQKAEREGYQLGEEKGYLVGEKDGLKAARFEWQTLMQETEMLITELQTSRMGMLKASEEEMLRLVIAFAKSVLKVEPTVNKDIILRNIDAALNKIADVDKIVMRINLRDKSMCEAHKDEFLRRLSTISELKIIEDGSLRPGGIKIETGVGSIDATIETQAFELETALMNHFKKASEQVFK